MSQQQDKTVTTEVRHNMSVITLCLPRHRAPGVVKALFSEGSIHSAYLSGARGTLIQDKWYKSLLPMLNPELEMVQLIAPDPKVDQILQLIIKHAELYRSGAGMVYSTPCDDVYAIGEFPLWPIDQPENPAEDATLTLQENLTAIHYINQGERTAAVCRAAINAGAHGPVVQYSRGVGLRDRLGWLRITSKPIKEVVSVVVDTVEADFIFAAMAEAGQVDRPGRGVIYRMPVQKGFINMDSVYSRARHTATMQQVIRAIDEIRGNKNWRDQGIIDNDPTRIIDPRNLSTPATGDPELLRISVIVDRIYSTDIARFILRNGASGVNMNYLQLHKAINGEDEKQHRDLAHVRAILTSDKALALQQKIVDDVEFDAMVYTQPTTFAQSYRAKVKRGSEAVTDKIYRGGSKI
ncbi:MAG: hypothetical protein ACWA44_12220 [Thiotrichales bacterium]